MPPEPYIVQEHGKNIASCSTDPGGAACQKGLAMNDALMVALPAGLGGGMLAAATPELAAMAKAAIAACTSNAPLCLNNAGIMTSEAIIPSGVGAGGAIGIGGSVADATMAKTIVSNVKANIATSQAGRHRTLIFTLPNQIRLSGAMPLIHEI